MMTEYPSFEPLIGHHTVLSEFDMFSTQDREQACAWGRQVFCENELDYLSPDGLDARMYYRKVGNVGLGRMSYGGEVIIRPAELESFILFQVPIKGQEIITQNGETVATDSRFGNFINSNRPSRVHHYRGTEKLIVRIDRAILEQYCQDYCGRVLTGPIEFAPGMDMTGQGGQRWMRTLSWAYDMLSVPDMNFSPIIEKQIEQSVISMALSCQPHNMQEHLIPKEAIITPAYIRRAKAFIEANAGNPICVADISREVGVSTRSLFEGFQRYADTTPNRFIKEFRLQRVNDELRASTPESTTVTSVALKWGFGHLGHFASAYKKRFGETPSHTLSRGA